MDFFETQHKETEMSEFYDHSYKGEGHVGEIVSQTSLKADCILLQKRNVKIFSSQHTMNYRSRANDTAWTSWDTPGLVQVTKDERQPDDLRNYMDLTLIFKGSGPKGVVHKVHDTK